MRIAFWHFFTFRKRRGIETLVLSQANALAEMGHEVSVVCAASALKPSIDLRANVKIYAFPTTRYFEHAGIIPFYAAHFLRYSYDAVVAFFSDFGEGAAHQWLTPFKKLPLTLYLCYPYSTVPHRYKSFLKWGWHQSAKHVIADAKWIAEEAEPVLERAISVVSVGTDTQRFAPNAALRQEMRKKFSIGPEETVVLSAAALEKSKGLHRNIRAAARLRKNRGSLKLFIVGSGSEEAVLKSLARDLGLVDCVYFPGESQRLEDFYNLSDLFLLLPDEEGNSVACHEAMCCGLPVVVSDTKGFRESVSEAEGILVNFRDEKAVDEGLWRMLADTHYRRNAGDRARQRMLATAGWDKRAHELTEILANTH